MKIKKHLIFYWYIPSNGVWYDIYDLHLKNLMLYRSVFDKVTFVISHNECSQESIDSLKIKITSIFGSKCVFTEFENDPIARETKFFYDEIVDKMDTFDKDEIVFFAHNKGVDSGYVTRNNLNYWINIMYYSNLFNIKKIDEYFEGDVCAVGDIKMVNYDIPQFSFLTHKWIYAGTFFWISPYRINGYIKDKDVELLEGYGRYYTEGFLGKLFPEDAKECISIHRPKAVEETNDQFLMNAFSDFEKYMYKVLYE